MVLSLSTLTQNITGQILCMNLFLVLRKGDVKSGRNEKREILPATHEEWTKEIANSVWHMAPVPPRVYRPSMSFS